MKISIIEPLGVSKEKLKIITEKLVQFGHEVNYTYELSNEVEKANIYKNSDVAIIVNKAFKQEQLQQFPNLKFVSVAFTGTDHVDIDYCKSHNIRVSNAAGYSTDAVAELTLGMMISMLRKLPEMEQNTRQLLDRKAFLGRELKGKTVGIIGFGAIGKRVYELCKAFKAEILVYNRTIYNEYKDVQFVELNELLEKSDVITIHTPLNDKTKGLLNKNNMSLLKSSSILINTARGPIVDYDFLSEMLNKNLIAGAAIDVYEYEPPLKSEHPLLKARNVQILPHIGYATQEAIEDRTEIAFENIIKWLNNKPQNVIC